MPLVWEKQDSTHGDMELYGELAMKGSRKYPFDPFICYCPLLDNGRPSVVEAYIRSPPSPST